jgi:hypothetical protein
MVVACISEKKGEEEEKKKEKRKTYLPNSNSELIFTHA